MSVIKTGLLVLLASAMLQQQIMLDQSYERYDALYANFLAIAGLTLENK